MSYYDFLIIGQGLAGSTLSYHLLKRGKKVLVIDSPDKPKSSMVAAGLYNPITGKNTLITWKANELFPYAISYFLAMEKQLGQRFLYPMPIYKPFTSIEDQNDWDGKSADDRYQPYISKIHTSHPFKDTFKNDYGGAEVTQAGYLDIPVYISALKGYLHKMGALLQTGFELGQATITDNGIEYNNTAFGKLIFCNGTDGYDSPPFSWLPFRPVKGELFELDMAISRSYIINKNGFIMPHHSGIVKAGATYENQDLGLAPTEKGKKQLIDKITSVTNISFDIKKQLVGIRPATLDRRPFIGMHPNLKNVGIFNGLGAKGVTLAPYFANHFCDHLLNGKKLMQEVDIKRYISLY